MNHFLVAVAHTSNPGTMLCDMLAPFNECLDVQPWATGADPEAILAAALASGIYPDGTAEADMLADWAGGEWKPGPCGTLQQWSEANPFGRWDWYAIKGGRWRASLGHRWEQTPARAACWAESGIGGGDGDTIWFPFNMVVPGPDGPEWRDVGENRDGYLRRAAETLRTLGDGWWVTCVDCHA